MYYNYVYLDPRKPGKYTFKGINISFLFEPIYIGKGKGGRCLKHLSSAKSPIYKNNKFLDKIRKIIFETNKDPFIIQFNFTEEEQIAYDNEEFLVNQIGRDEQGTLCNLMDGGRNGNNRTGWTEERKKKYSKKYKGYINTKQFYIDRYGETLGLKQWKKITDRRRINVLGNKNPAKRLDVKKKISEGNKKFNKENGSPWTGKKHKKETKEKISKSRLEKNIAKGKNNPMSKRWCFISPKGKEYIIEGETNKFCKEYKIPNPSLLRKACKEGGVHHGWTGKIL